MRGCIISIMVTGSSEGFFVVVVVVVVDDDVFISRRTSGLLPIRVSDQMFFPDR